ncbi:MAG: STAS-like domain-containing protein [Pseudomonadota bacterium]
MMRLSIRSMIGPRCITKEDGQRVYDSIHDPLKGGESVALDFDGVSQFASPFFNFAIGQLLKDIKEDGLRRFLQIENLNSTGKLVVERVIENAGRYHADIDYRKIVDDILEQQAREAL